MVKFPSIEVNPNYNPFSEDKKTNVKENLDLIKNNFQNHMLGSENSTEQNLFEEGSYLFLQLGFRHIITIKKNGLLIIDVFRAHQQVKFEELVNIYDNGEVSAQKLLHPVEIELSASDILMCLEIKEDLERLGVEMDQFGKNSIVLNTFPTDVNEVTGKSFIEDV